MERNFKAFGLLMQTLSVAGMVGLGMFLVGHLLWSLTMWEFLAIDWQLLSASVGFPVGVVLLLALLDLEFIYEMANKEE